MTLLAADEAGVWVADPVWGVLHYPWEDFREQYTGEVIVFTARYPQGRGDATRAVSHTSTERGAVDVGSGAVRAGAGVELRSASERNAGFGRESMYGNSRAATSARGGRVEAAVCSPRSSIPAPRLHDGRPRKTGIDVAIRLCLNTLQVMAAHRAAASGPSPEAQGPA